MDDYGPFTAALAMVACLAISFGFLLTKAVGRLADWNWLSGKPPEVLQRTAVKALAIALIAFTYVKLEADNADAFLILAVLLGVLTAVLAFYLQRLVHVHVEKVPVTGHNGQQDMDDDGNPMFQPTFMGSELNMRTAARAAYRKAKKQDGSISLAQFMSGYGTPPNNPQAIWSRYTLAAVRTRLHLFALATVLTAVMTLYVAASSLVAMQDSVAPDVDAGDTHKAVRLLRSDFAGRVARPAFPQCAPTRTGPAS